MEKITINKLEPTQTTRGQGLKVMYDGGRVAGVAPWDSKIIDYLVQEVGIAGSVDVEFQFKDGYANIVAVNMTTGRPRPKQEAVNQDPTPDNQPKHEKVAPVENAGWTIAMTAKDEFILAQVVLKEANNTACATLLNIKGWTADQYGEVLVTAIDELVSAFKYSYSRVKAL